MQQGALVWEATTAQQQMLSSTDYEVLYGGAAGGGKSDALLIDGWCIPYGGPKNKNHRAVVFRRSFPELKDLIDRARELFPQFIRGVKYDQNEHRFTTPYGAKFEFGYLQNDQDRFKYRGRAWNWIGFDELTLWPTITCYEYLRTRNRSVDRTLPKFIRATTNPDGPGQKWVMDRWGISQEGAGTRIVVVMNTEVPDGNGGWREEPQEFTRRFIPAKLRDNPHLRGTGYRETLQLMDDAEITEALLEGMWIGNRVKGAVYVNQMQALRREGRIGKYPYIPGYPVNTFWDLGYNDTTAIWLHQQIGPENRFIHCFESSGVGLEYYAAELTRLAAERKYTYRRHYLPHDAAHRTRKAQGKNDQELLEELLPNETFEIVPVTPSVITGIRQTRSSMVSATFDQEGCSDGIAALDAYHFKYDANLGAYSQEPVHDWASNYADALRQWGQGYEGVFELAEQATPEWKRAAMAQARGRARNPATA